MNEGMKKAEGEAYAAQETAQRFLSGPDNPGLLGLLTVAWLRDPGEEGAAKLWINAGGFVDALSVAAEMLRRAANERITAQNQTHQRLAALENVDARLVRVIQ